MHHGRWRRTGRPEGGRTIVPIEDRFWAKVNKTASCFEWTAYRNADGYGIFAGVGAHLWAYRHFIGPVPDGCELDHLCSNRACVRLDHLDPVPHRENVLRGNGLAAQQARQTHCKHGHEFTPENTRVRANRKRDCLTCEREYNARRSRKK